jgi:DNA-binding NarL/FixJ family response regulator
VSDSDTVTVVLGRFEPFVASGLAHALGADPRVHILERDLEERALERTVAQQRPRVTVLGEAVDYALLMRLKESHPVTGILVVAPDPERLCGTMLLEAGASCLARSASIGDLLTAVHLTARGRPTFFCADGSRRQRPHPSGALTSREAEVLKLLNSGCTNPEIAAALCISAATARTHVANIFSKLNVHSRLDLIGALDSVRNGEPR